MPAAYLFNSSRLGFRSWTSDDIESFHLINADPDVMRYFPNIPTLAETTKFIESMQAHYEDKKYCYYVVEMLETRKLIGAIGLADKTFEASFTPCTDIGWRIDKKFWGNGYATEGALACLKYGFSVLGLDKIVAMCPVVNIPSENVMKRIGMTKSIEFKHPALKNHPSLEPCVLYVANASQFVTTVESA